MPAGVTKGAASGIPFTLAPRPNFFFFGDSITQAGSKVEPLGWVLLLADAYLAVNRCAEVSNRGFAGYNTRWGLVVLPQLIKEHGPIAPCLATIFFGANDACREGARQHVPLAEYRKNLGEIIALMTKAWPQVTIILITPPPIDKEAWDAFKGQDGERCMESVGEYAGVCKGVAAETGCQCLDLFEEMGKLSDWKAMMMDGLHFNGRGNAVVHDLLKKLIDTKLPHLSSSKLPIHLPHHTDIDGESYMSVLQ